MSIRSKKLYLFFFIFLAGLLSTSMVLSRNNRFDSKVKDLKNENTSYSQELTGNKNLSIDDIKVSSN